VPHLQATADGSPEYEELCNTLANCEPDKATQANLQQVILEKAYSKTAVRGEQQAWASLERHLGMYTHAQVLLTRS
jgi:hypothetical protein